MKAIHATKHADQGGRLGPACQLCSVIGFLAGFAYVVAAIGLWRGTLWAGRFSLGIAAATALVFMAFGIHVTFGGAYELRTVAAMTLRLFVWLGIGWLARPQRVQLA